MQSPEAAARVVREDCIYWADNHLRQLTGTSRSLRGEQSEPPQPEATARAVLQTAFIGSNCNARGVEFAACAAPRSRSLQKKIIFGGLAGRTKGASRRRCNADGVESAANIDLRVVACEASSFLSRSKIPYRLNFRKKADTGRTKRRNSQMKNSLAPRPLII